MAKTWHIGWKTIGAAIVGIAGIIGAAYQVIGYYYPPAPQSTPSSAVEQQGPNVEKAQGPTESPSKLEVGKDSVVMGSIPNNTKVGEGSVVIGPTDSQGNTKINTPMAVGRNAKAGPGSIAIGANANSGSQHK